MMARHPQAIRRDERFDATKPRHELRSICEWIKHFPRQLERRSPPPDEPCDVGKHVAEEDVVAAKNVTLSDSPAFKRGEVPGCDVIDMREIESGVDKGRHAPQCGLDDDAAGRRRPNVARTDRG